jgi:hypothetical protein
MSVWAVSAAYAARRSASLPGTRTLMTRLLAMLAHVEQIALQVKALFHTRAATSGSCYNRGMAETPREYWRRRKERARRREGAQAPFERCVGCV